MIQLHYFIFLCKYMQRCFSDPFINTACKAEPEVISHFSIERWYIKTRTSKAQEKRLLLLNQTLQNKIHEVEFKKDSLTISLVFSQKKKEMQIERSTAPKGKWHLLSLKTFSGSEDASYSSWGGFLFRAFSLICPPCILGTEASRYCWMEKSP